MTDHPQLRLRYALLKGTTEGLLFVDDVPNGLKCNCVCSHCGKELIARNNPRNKREHHFAHRGGADCKGARMTTLHKLAQQIIKEERKIMLPAYDKQYVQKGARLGTYDEVELEVVCKAENSNRRPDCIGYNDSRRQNTWIEIFCQHQIDPIKREEIIQNRQYCIEINFKDLLNTNYTKESVKNRLLTCFEDREWICHPEWDDEEMRKEAEEMRILEEEQKKRDEEIKRFLEESKRKQEELMRKQEAERRKLAERLKNRPRVSISDSSSKTIRINDRASESPNNGIHDWVTYAKRLYAEGADRETFYSTLTRQYAKVTLENSEPILVKELHLKINELLPRTDYIVRIQKIYLEILIAIWILDKLNHSECLELSRIFVSNQNIRYNIYKTIKRIGNIYSSGIEGNLIPINLENRDVILQILRTCYM